MAVVEALYAYPVKSCGAVALESAHVTPQGLGVRVDSPAGSAVVPVDRQWCVVSEEGEVQDIRVQPALATLSVALDAGGGAAGRPPALVLRDPAGGAGGAAEALRLPLLEGAYAEGAPVQVSDRHRHKWFGRPLPGYCASEEASRWITRFLQRHGRRRAEARFRLVRYATSVQARRIRESFGGKSAIARRASHDDTAAFADCAPYHVLSLGSLDDLSDRLPPQSAVERPVSAQRFRPNVLLGGAAPYAEDAFGRFAVGGVRFRQLGPTGRCVIPTTDPATGGRDDDEEPRATLLSYRPMPYGDGVHGGPTLGIWAAPADADDCDDARNVVAVGDAVACLGESMDGAAAARL